MNKKIHPREQAGGCHVENECDCSFSAVVGQWCWQRINCPRFVVKTRGVCGNGQAAVENERTCLLSMVLGGGIGTRANAVENERACSFLVVVLAKGQTPLKTGVLARFRQWVGGGAGKGPNALGLSWSR